TRLTVPAGVSYVQVVAWINLGYQCTVCEIYLLKNGTSLVGTSYGATANTGFGSDQFTAIAPIVQVSPGDYFTVGVYQNTGDAVWAYVTFSIIALAGGATATGSPLKAMSIAQTVSVPDGWGDPLIFSGTLFDTGGFCCAQPHQPTHFYVPAGVNYVQVAASID